jgi:hypothetical protein
MKIAKYLLSISFAVVMAALVGCEDTYENPLPVFESAVHGYAEKKSTGPDFSLADPTKSVAYRFRWASIDGLNTVNKIQFLVTLREGYTDKDGNGRTAVHGTKVLKVIDSNVPGNFTFSDYTMTQAEVYNLFKDATFNYGNGSVKVFDQNSRTPAKPLTGKDNVVVSWVLFTADGRKFDTWGGDVCSATLDKANCSISFAVK